MYLKTYIIKMTLQIIHMMNIISISMTMMKRRKKPNSKIIIT